MEPFEEGQRRRRFRRGRTATVVFKVERGGLVLVEFVEKNKEVQRERGGAPSPYL